MIENLRKGHSFVYLEYPNVGETMGAEKFEGEIKEGILLLRFKLRAAGQGQKMDEDHLHRLELQSVTIDDDYIVTRLKEFAESSTFSAFHLEIISHGKHMVFSGKAETSKRNGLKFSVESRIS